MPTHYRPLLTSRFSHRRAFSIVSLALISFTSPLAGTSVHAKDHFKPANGEFHTQMVVGPSCPSPVGVCASGSASGDLEGDVFVVITSSTPGVDSSGNFVSKYTADITITNNKGRVDGTIDGAVQIYTGQLNSTITVVGGTNHYHKASGTLNVSGNLNFATGQEVDTYSGTLSKN
jgi:hypothetical protein